MVARFRSWRQHIITHPVTTVLISLFITLVVLVILGGYKLNWNWTGFNGNNKSGKTLWDWLQLLIIPLALAIIAIFFNRAERKNEQRIASDNQQEAALQGYINEMSELMLERDLRKSDVDAEVRTIARVRTLTVLSRLDKDRKRSVLQFLNESGLIEADTPIIRLNGANLSGANLSEAYLNGANLALVDLSGANLRRVRLGYAPRSEGEDIGGADLSHANLSKANLSAADLEQVNLRSANLTGANLSAAHLERVNLRSANLTGADLSHVNLTEANLSHANLTGADLTNTELNTYSPHMEGYGADLSRANLRNAKITIQQLEKAKSLQGATMPDGSIHA